MSYLVESFEGIAGTGALLIGAGQCLPAARSTSFDRWPFMRRRDDNECLHDRISDKVKEGMNFNRRLELEYQQQEYDNAFKGWSMMACSDSLPPDLNEYPLVKEHAQSVQEVESCITRSVLETLTCDENRQLKYESNPLGGSFAPKPMSDEVVRRIREQTRRYLGRNQVSQREHNRT